MKLFKDNAGREWTIRVDANGLRRVQDLLGLDLSDLRSMAELLHRLRASDLFAIDVAWALCQPQAAAHQPPLTREQFSELLAGDAIEQAYQAIAAELPDFFRDSTKRQAARSLVELSQRHITELAELAGRLASLSSGSTSGSNSAPSADCSGSIPAPTPSAS